MSIRIQVRNKVAVNLTPEEVIVCGNSGYEVEFSFDEEWASEAVKTARFVYRKGGQNYFDDVVFTGTTVEAPVLSGINNVLVGVYAGDLITTTPAVVECDKSILCGSGTHKEPTPDVYNQLIELINAVGVGGGGAAGFSPVANVSQTATGAVITITDKTGTTSATIVNGKDGAKGDTGATGAAGKNGVSATHSWNGTTLTITSASGTSSADLKGAKGEPGADGQPGLAGKSAYQYALDGGYTGTEEEFARKLASESSAIHIGSEPPEDENVTVWIDTDEEPEASGIDVTAEVGQTIIVKAVDENGKPTEWESADYQPRTHWVESEHKVLLDTTVTTSQNMAALQQKIELQEGQTCIVTFGGQQYSCTCRYLAYMGFLGLAIGNTYPIDGNNTGEPFVVMYVPLMNVIYVVIMLPDGEHSIKVEGEVKSYHTIPSAFLPKPCWMIEFDLDNPSTDVTRIELDKAIDNGEMIALRGRRYVNATVIMYYFEYRSQSGECAFCDGYGRNRITLTPNASGGYDMTEGTT